MAVVPDDDDDDDKEDGNDHDNVVRKYERREGENIIELTKRTIRWV